MAAVFISHSSKDKTTATTLAEDLRKLGHSPWLDSWEIKVGDCIVTKVEHGIATCDAVVVLLSTHSVASNWVDREWKAKYWDEIQANKVMVLPVRLDDCEMPQLLKTKKYADFRGNGYATGLVSLVAALPGPVVTRTDGPALPKSDDRVPPLLSKIHARTAPLAECVADALSLAISLGDDDLRAFCENELRGFDGLGQGGVGEPRPEDRHRVIETFVSATAEINPSYFGWGQDWTGVFRMMEESPEFSRMKLVWSKPLGETERRAAEADKRQLLVITMPITTILPQAQNPRAKIRCYAHGDALGVLVERVRAELSTRVMKHLPTVRPGGGGSTEA